MAIQIGQQLGSLEITALLGKGGMGEVYRARDTKLKRDVAVKILPDEFSRDADRVARFQREAEVLASLSHPNIAGIYDLQQTDETRFLVMELVEGETLADRIKRGPLPLEEALQIGKSICEALEAAHEKGIVHRDLKPANIKITADGKVKVLDFGLAKAMESTPTTTLSNSPTLISLAVSNAGIILGTAAYMSPEQAKGKLVDKRADIWAFGVVLYEMLTGRMLFSGETVSETMAFVMTKDPDWSVLPADTPARVSEFLRRCLTKDPRNRLQAIGEARIAIEGVNSGSETTVISPPVVYQRGYRLWMTTAVIAIIIAAAMAIPAVRHFREEPSVAPRELRTEIITPSTQVPQEFALSPDGRYIAFVASGDGPQRLWLRSLDKTDAQPMPGTDGADYPFWSPDSVSIGFFAAGKLKRIDTGARAPQVVGNAAAGRGGAWNDEGIILFATAAGPLFKVSATGGEPVPITRLEAGQSSHRFPQFLPDGRHFVYFVFGSPTTPGEYAGSLDGGSPKRLVSTDESAVVSPLGFLLFLRQLTLFAQAFDFKRQELSGSPFSVAEQVAFDPVLYAPGFSATWGMVAYRSGSAAGVRQLTWVDRSGKNLGSVGAPDPAALFGAELSPDGQHVAVNRTVNGNIDVWLVDTARGVPTRLTFDAAQDQLPIWSPDGSRVVFTSTRQGVYNLYSKLSSGAGADELLLESDQIKLPSDWSPDGRFLLFRGTDPKTGFDLWVLPFSGDKKPFVFLKTPFEEQRGQFSPDGKWVAYDSNESGRYEVYVQPFPGPGGKFQISTNGGAQPRWNKNGKEIFYISLDNKMMAAPVKLAPDGKSLEAGTPAALFLVRITGGPVTGGLQQYAVSADGQRFMVNLEVSESTSSPITLILNWKPPKP